MAMRTRLAAAFFTGSTLSGLWLLYSGVSQDGLPASALKVALLAIAGGGLSMLAEVSNYKWMRASLRAAFLPWLFLVLPWAVTFGSESHSAMSRVGIIYWIIATACLAIFFALTESLSIRTGKAAKVGIGAID
jgi:hypothetical protein